MSTKRTMDVDQRDLYQEDESVEQILADLAKSVNRFSQRINSGELKPPKDNKENSERSKYVSST